MKPSKQNKLNAIIDFFHRQPHKMVKYTQTIRRLLLELRIVWVCLTILWGWRLKDYGPMEYILWLHGRKCTSFLPTQSLGIFKTSCTASFQQQALTSKYLESLKALHVIISLRLTKKPFFSLALILQKIMSKIFSPMKFLSETLLI